MLATPAATLPAGPDWTYEVKWDGYRALAVKTGGRVRLISRNEKELTRDYPKVVAAVAALAAKDLVLDGEIVALDRDGRPSFQALQHQGRGAGAIVFYAFDLLSLNGRELLSQPLEQRRRALAKAIKQSSVLLNLSRAQCSSSSGRSGVTASKASSPNGATLRTAPVSEPMPGSR
jgi:bifunctional non-homologous end joining protein LigD